VSTGRRYLDSRRVDVDHSLWEEDLDPLLLKAGEDSFSQLMLNQILVRKLVDL
jgi:hypothetical protein